MGVFKKGPISFKIEFMTTMNVPFMRLPQSREPTPEEMKQAQVHAYAQAQAQAHAQAQAQVALGQTNTDPWGKDGSCLGLKILCGAFALIVVVLLVVLIVKMVHQKPSSGSSSGVSALPTSLAGGAFDMESLMSTGSI